MSRLDERTRKKIRKKFKETGSIRGTARIVGVSRNSVRRELRRRDHDAPRKRPSRAGKLDPYKAKISYLVKEKDLSGVRILEEIRDLGYSGGYSTLKYYIRTLRPKRICKATSPIDHPPGYEGQMDWSEHRVIIGGRKEVVHTGSIVLSFSRALYIQFFTNEQIEQVISLHEQAFEKFDCVPERMTYDNMTTVGRHVGMNDIWINPTFKAFAEKYGFDVIINPPGAKDLHGAVERPFHYIKNNCLKGREFDDFEHLKRHGQWWLDSVANVRIHGTLRERPIDRLEREKPMMKNLPHKRFERYKQISRVIHSDFCVVVDTNRYSVHPTMVGKEAQIRLYSEHLEIWNDHELLAKHTYQEGRYGRQVLPEHEKAWRGSHFQSNLLQNAFIRLGESAGDYFNGLKESRGSGAGYHLQRILKLADRYGSDVVSGAMAHAQRHGIYSADAVSRIIHGKELRKKGRLIPEDVPENIRQWLKSCSVENQKSSSYDDLIVSSFD